MADVEAKKKAEEEAAAAKAKAQEDDLRQLVFDLNKLLAEIRLASMNIVDGLLAKQESKRDAPHLKILAARVHITLNEATSLADGVAQDSIPPYSLESQNGTGLEELEARVQSTLKEAASLSNEDIEEFVLRYPLVIPLPSALKQSSTPTSLRIQTTDTGTPVRSNKVIVLSCATKVNSENFNPMPSSPKATVMATASSAETTKDDFMRRTKSALNPLAKQASDLMREARAAMQKNKQAAAMPAQKVPTIQASKGKTPTRVKGNRPVGNKASPKNFGGAAMPSPIRHQKESPNKSLDWDWASEW